MAGASTSIGISNTQLPQFNGKNYDYCAINMTALPVSKDSWEFVKDGFQELANENEFMKYSFTTLRNIFFSFISSVTCVILMYHVNVVIQDEVSTEWTLHGIFIEPFSLKYVLPEMGNFL